MQFKLFNKLFILIPISFVILIFSFYISFENTSSNQDIIKYLQKDQMKLSYLSNKISHDIRINQILLQQSIIYKKDIDKNKIQESLKVMRTTINRLDAFSRKNKIEDFQEIMFKIKERFTTYSQVTFTLIDTIQTTRQEKVQSHMLTFDITTLNFSNDIERLIDITNTALYTNILNLKMKNNESATLTLVSFLIALLLISITIYKINSQSKHIKEDFIQSEKIQSKLQEQLLKYNEDLENEIVLKTKELQTKMYTHFLSGLPNRNKLLEDLDMYSFSQIALLNIDKFQKFNDVYGEEMGNIAIQLTANFLLDEVNGEDIILYHIGGDEFVYTRKKSDNNYDNSFIRKIEYILSSYSKKTFSNENENFTFTMSAGIAFTGKKRILAYADMSLKDAKKRNIQLSIYNDEESLEKTHQEDIECHKQLIHAFKTDSILSHFQPIVPIQDSNKSVRYESLVRMKEISGKIVPPFKFIDVAVANRIYYKITAQVLKNTLDVVEKHKVPCSLNISILDIENRQTLKLLYDTFQGFQYNNYVTIELLETEEFRDYTAVYDFCVKIRSFGIKIALDDFGAGYSSFAHIMNLPIDFIKIDASLISNIDRDEKAQIMVGTIVSLAQKLNIETIAEFVSSKEILNVIKKLKVDYAQGFYTGKPTDISEHLKTTHL